MTQYNSFAMIQSRPVDMIKFLFFAHLYQVFFYPKQATKPVFHCRSQNAEFTGNSKVVDREIMMTNSLGVQSLKCIEDRLLLSHLGI